MRKRTKIWGIVAVSFLLLVVLLQVAFNSAYVQNRLKNGVAELAGKQLNAAVTIGRFQWNFPRTIRVHDVLMRNTSGDSLLQLTELGVKIRLLPLLKKQVLLQHIEVKALRTEIDALLGEMDSSTYEKNEEPVTDAATWEIQAEKFSVEQSYIGYHSQQAGIKLVMDVGALHLKLGTFNPDSFIHISSIAIENTQVQFETFMGAQADTTETTFAQIWLENASLRHSSFTYLAPDSSMVLNTGGEHLQFSEFLLNLNQSSVSMNTGLARRFYCDIRMDEPYDSAAITHTELNWGESLWRIAGNALELDDFRFSMNDVQVKETHGHFDPAHFRFETLTGSLNDFIINTDTLILSINNLSGTEHHGLKVEELSVSTSQKNGMFNLNDLHLQTPDARYTGTLSTQINPTNYTHLKGKSMEVSLEVDARSLHDIDYFYPLQSSLTAVGPQVWNAPFTLRTSFTGDVNEFEIQAFDFSALSDTRVRLSATLKNPDTGNAPSAEVTLHQLASSAKDVTFILGDGTGLPDGISLPKTFGINGQYALNVGRHSFRGMLKSSAGEVAIQNMRVDLKPTPSYTAQLKANLHHLQQVYPGWEKAAFTLDAKFRGESLHASQAALRLKVDSIRHLGHTYHGLDVNGNLADGNYSIDVGAQDSSLMLATHLEGLWKPLQKSIRMDAVLHQLNPDVFTGNNDSVRIAGGFLLAGEMLGDKKITANLQVGQVDLYYKDSLYVLQPAQLHFASDTFATDFSVKSEFYNAKFQAGAFVTEVLAAFRHLPSYYLGNTTDSAQFPLPDFEVAAKVEYPQAFATHFFPQYPSFDSLTLQGKHVHALDQFHLEAFLPGLAQNSMQLEGMHVWVNGSSKYMLVEAETRLIAGELLQGNARVSGTFADSKMLANLRYYDVYGDEFLNFSAQVDTLNERWLVHLVPDSLRLWYAPWTVDSTNRIEISSEGIALHKVALYNHEQGIAFVRDSLMKKSDVALHVTDLKIGKTGKLLNLDSTATGTVNANLQLLNLQASPTVKGQVRMDNTAFYGINFGSVHLRDLLYTDTLIAGKLDMRGENQVLQLDGSLSHMENLDARLTIESLQLNALNKYLPSQVQQAKGSMQANLVISGSTRLPMLNGNLFFTDAGLRVMAVNQYFSFGNDRVKVANNVLKFTDFSIENERKQRAKINGNISLVSGNRVYNDLRLITDNMEWINSTEKDNELFFGVLKARSDVQIKGPSDAVKIKARVHVDKATQLTYVFPDKLTIADNHGIVTYTPYVNDTTPLPETQENNVFFGFGAFDDVETRLEIEKGTRFKMHFDAGGENFLDASLNGVLNYYMKGINNEITGVFEIDQGKLHYNIPMVTVDNFDLEPGSTITLSNDMYNPYLNIVASSKIRASTEGLMSEYKKVMTFKVLLFMEGELNNLKLRFDISTETGDAIVSSTLAQLSEKERNVNALNLLVRGTFVLSLQGAGAGATTTAQAQIDKIYADGLNSLVSDNIKFVDLHFDVQSFEDYGEDGGQVFRRNYYYEVGKSFFNERARVNYKGRLEMMDNGDFENTNSTFVQNQLEVEFKLNKEGNLRAVFFRKDQYEGLLEGQVIETGGGFRLTNSFYSIKDIFVNEDNKRAKAYRDQRLKNEK